MKQSHYNELMKIAADLETEGDGAIAKALRAALASDAAGEPKDWKLVPVEPTPAMLAEIDLIDGFTSVALTARYKAMLAAAPTPTVAADAAAPSLKAPEGEDPMRFGDRGLDASVKRLTDAYCVQQPAPVPDQMALVWRFDIGRLRNDWLRLNAWQKSMAAQPGERTTPFSNCKFRECDLPGQCRGEGACHHPRDTAPLPHVAAPVAESVAMIQTLMIDWINSEPGPEAKSIWVRIEEKLVALAAHHAARRGMQKIMARLTELLDEDHFAEIEEIVKNAGVEPPDAATAAVAQDEATEREAFTAWVEKKNPTKIFRSYAWCGWNARALLSTAPERMSDAEHAKRIIQIANETSATCTSREWLFEHDHLIAFANGLNAARKAERERDGGGEQ